MARGAPSIMIDARVNSLAGAHGIARSVMTLIAHLERPGGDLAGGDMAVKVLINPDRPQIFPLSQIPAHVQLIGTDITVRALHRCWDLARLIKASGAAVLYVPYPPFTPLIRPCPIVVTLHDCTIESDTGFAGGWRRQAGMKLVTRAVVRRAAAVTAPTRASLADIGRHYPGPPDPALVPNGVDIDQFAGVTAVDVAAARELYGLPGRYVLTVGAHRPHKNHEVLVRALAALPGSVSLVIVGYFDPAFPEPLPALMARLGLESRVLLLPEVADRWLPAVYRAASVFAFPSLAEGFGIPALEAMACGVPVVASDIPALAEVTRSAATLVDPRDVAAWASALASVLTSRALADRMSAAGTEVARAQTWSRGAAALHGLLRAVAIANHESYRVRSPMRGLSAAPSLPARR